MLFATRSVAPKSPDVSGKPVFSSLSFFGNHHWNDVQAASSSYEDQEIIRGSKFPKLAGSPSRVLLDICIVIQEVLKTSPKAFGGVASTPQFPRGIDVDVPDSSSFKPSADKVFKHPSLREEIFSEAVSFVSYIHALRLWRTLPELSAALQASPKRLLNHDVVNADSGTSVASQTVHPPSSILNLLTRMCTSVPHSESVLLVAEIGTGKTTTIRHSAQLLSRPLTVISLSNQTASSGLLGAFKPIDARIPGTELQLRFVALFTNTFSLEKSERFFDVVGSDVRSSK
ncbi:hypothetical protein M407DRAFT_26142 [Tulasnella calospora MUT 4182]|uniref:Uncharacterized protein n=1 Tax=Tulasnella calospora MUT 4182 TaxID=1051891 RepID=A0A0C3Q5J9_9AGAM|nr:hypothetical protein M407DRAFT_26142 [Tulasnella calospora MUT 4182]